MKSTSKSRVRIYVTKGNLPGYTLKKSLAERRLVLEKLAKKDSWGTIVKRLNVLYIYNKNRHPETAIKFKRDMKYIQRIYSPRKRSVSLKRKTHKKIMIKSQSASKRKSYKKRSQSKRTSKRKSYKKRTSKRKSYKN